MTKPKTKCLIEGCVSKTKIYSRGLCCSHYQMILHLVKMKERTWEEFEKVGMAFPSKRGVGNPEQKKMLFKMMKKKFL